MTPRPPESFVHGLDGPVAVVPARVAAVLLRRTNLADYAAHHRGHDPEVDATLVALRLIAATWSASRGGDPATSRDTTNTNSPQSAQWLSTTQTARRLGITAQAVRKAVTEQRIPAQLIGGRWVLDRADVETWAAIRQSEAA